MRWKPAIILFLLVFLSICGAGLYTQFKPRPIMPRLSEVDKAIREIPPTTSWQMDEYHFHPRSLSAPIHHTWIDVGMWRYKELDKHSYHVKHITRGHPLIVAIWEEDGRATGVEFGAPLVDQHLFENYLFGKFPELRSVRRADP